MDTMLDFVDAMDRFGLIRKEPVLVVGGGLASDVAGYACASYRRSTNYIRVGTTLIALIDAAISIKVGINHKKLKNRLGAYHAPMHSESGKNWKQARLEARQIDTLDILSIP